MDFGGKIFEGFLAQDLVVGIALFVVFEGGVFHPEAAREGASHTVDGIIHDAGSAPLECQGCRGAVLLGSDVEGAEAADMVGVVDNPEAGLTSVFLDDVAHVFSAELYGAGGAVAGEGDFLGVTSSE